MDAQELGLGLDLENETMSYSGLSSLNKNALERELEMCKKLGADAEKLRALNFNALQLSEIRKGIIDKVDVAKYMDPRKSWTEMEELRLEMTQNIDMSSYRKQGFDVQQLAQIRKGIAAGIDVSVYAKKEYFADQMRELRIGLSRGEGVPIIFFQDPAFDSLQMREIRKGLEEGIDISNYASVDIPYMKMRAIRKSAEDGLFFSDAHIRNFNASILEQMHAAYNDKVDIIPYIKEKYDAEQIEQIRLCLKEKINIDKYINPEMRSDAIKEIRIGLENGVEVGRYADASYGWQQMYEMRIGLEHQIDITPYCNPLYQADQMKELRLGIEEGLDISAYSSMMYTARDMRRIRERIMGEGYGFVDRDKHDNEALDRTEGVPNETVLLNYMLENRDEFLSFTSDEMICWIQLPTRNDGAAYTEDLIMSFLVQCRIMAGIDKEAIGKMLSKLNPNEKYVIAAGKAPVDGVDGYYEFLIDLEQEQEPTILSDGTADLSNIEAIKQVKAGDKIAIYHKAKKGEDGYNVYGEALRAKNGKEIPILKGDGFMILNDRVTYVAKYSGAISMVDGVINIEKIMIVPEVKITDKKIVYDGVVYVTGDVHSGSGIDASGDVIIGGHMESSEIVSGRNVIIKGGATCPIRGSIKAKGDVSAKFFEGVIIHGKNISANYFINCNVVATGLIKTYGRVGTIYGGSCQSLFGIETASVGNKAGAKTIVTLGVNNTILTELSNINKSISREEEELNSLKVQRDRLAEDASTDRQIMQWKIKVNAAIGMKEGKIKDLIEKKNKVQAEIDKGSEARATITEVAYSGTVFVIDGMALKIEQDRKTYDKLTIKASADRESIEVI
ncbi:DUF342 domain-containing protein [Butyrivibrio sp. LB2008]|uniref:DUF342 domain-containing protein n=1 Tax=Butyrivibrio sp. LB2008 TaxID=1408305 RepID=UPI00047E2257|nr:FapA family protein [Butyrivibrio sp. LB2008]